MAKRTVSKGVCEACHKEVSKSAMTRHLAGCLETQETGKSGKTSLLHHLIVEAPGMSEYWLHIEVPTSATLAHIDTFLRGIWLECCGHMSAFRVGRQTYAAHPDPEAEEYTGVKEKSMGTKIGPLVGLSPWSYEYDFGSTTELRIRVLGAREGVARGVRLLARNAPPPIACQVCGQPAVSICSQCVWDDGGWMCKACTKAHKCGADYTLPVVNSPRVGVCGYTG
jgi:hypothetical protein